MIILHPWTSGRNADKLETWRFVESIKLYCAGNGITVVNRNINRPMDYTDMMKEFWGREDLIVLEDDKVPTLADLKELVGCPHAYCCFPYPISFYFYTPMSLWEDDFPMTLGFVKFSLLAQKNLPVHEWPAPEKGRWPGWGLDARIERPMIERFGPMHLHKKWIRHNHNRGPVGRLKGLSEVPGARALSAKRFLSEQWLNARFGLLYASFPMSVITAATVTFGGHPAGASGFPSLPEYTAVIFIAGGLVFRRWSAYFTGVTRIPLT